MDPLTYRSAGVDIGAGDEAVRRIKRLAASTQRPEVLGGIGAFAASGLHSNGYTLARKVVFERMGLKPEDTVPGLGRSAADELLEPTRIYVMPVLGLLKSVAVLAMAHVTGGGISENLPRVLPEG